MATSGDNGPLLTHVDVDDAWERDDETGGLVRMLYNGETTQIGLWKPGALAGSAIEFEPQVPETFVVLNGTGELRVDDGGPVELRLGVIVSLKQGCRTRWVVDSDFQELWVYS
jgi:uncharacterized cupin superfamily protein